ncbi:uncharacterized protein ACNLHF_000668 isoform 1-T1 [Anomaloglossus baeobatrachus]|uniref:uncharacterized protein LOC142251704 isoform X1 n=1 Tax=Anomaloglossus baeobatrachus TaxID=238106 RepID=UPI003F4FBF76
MSAALEELIGKIRAIAVVRGEAWLREKVAEILPDEGQESQDPPPCAKRGRALERRSPSPVPRNRPKLSSKDPPEVSGGPRPASEGPCPAENPFSLGSDSRDASHKYGNKGLRIPVKAASQHGSGNRPSSEVAGAVSAENQKSSSDFSSSLNRRTVKAESCDKSNNRKVSATSHSSNTEVESIELRIERLLQRCSEIQQEEDEPPEPTPAPVSSSVTGAATVAASLGLGRQKVMKLEPTIVWIVGHSYVYWAQKRAAIRSYTENLTFSIEHVNIYWFGSSGMKWAQLVDELKRKVCSAPLPDLIIIHLGGNDIGKVKTLEFISQMQRDITFIKKLFPNTSLVFSEIIPRLLWNSDGFLFFEKIRKRVNRTMEKFCRATGDFSFRHTDLEGFLFGLYRSDGVHLSDIGVDIFNLGLQSIVEKWLCCGLGETNSD